MTPDNDMTKGDPVFQPPTFNTPAATPELNAGPKNVEDPAADPNKPSLIPLGDKTVKDDSVDGVHDVNPGVTTNNPGTTPPRGGERLNVTGTASGSDTVTRSVDEVRADPGISLGAPGPGVEAAKHQLSDEMLSLHKRLADVKRGRDESNIPVNDEYWNVRNLILQKKDEY